MAFARMNNWSFWLLPPAAILLMSSLLRARRRAGVGLDALCAADRADGHRHGPAIFAVHILGMRRRSWVRSTSSTTILNMRAPGMTLMKMPLFVWTWLITAYLLIAVMPVLAGAVTMIC
jgi:cytochrome c oxidase subunit 1